MALNLRKACSFISTRLYRYQWNVINKFSVESKPDVSSLTHSHVAHSSVFEKLKNKYGNNMAFHIIFQENPELNAMNYSQWSKFFELMTSFDFQVNEILTMIRDCPDILKLADNILRERLEIWYGKLKMVNNKEAKVLLLNHPQYLLIEPKKLRLRIHLLTEFNTKNKKSLKLLFLQCPNVLFEDHRELLEKMNYLIVNWRFTPLEISRTCALTYPIDFIKLRMTLADKCGIYKMPYPYTWKKKKVELMKVKNPYLKHLVDTSDEDFAQNVAQISVEELEVYKIIFEETLEAVSDSDEEIDYDDTDL